MEALSAAKHAVWRYAASCSRCKHHMNPSGQARWLFAFRGRRGTAIRLLDILLGLNRRKLPEVAQPQSRANSAAVDVARSFPPVVEKAEAGGPRIWPWWDRSTTVHSTRWDSTGSIFYRWCNSSAVQAILANSPGWSGGPSRSAGGWRFMVPNTGTQILWHPGIGRPNHPAITTEAIHLS